MSNRVERGRRALSAWEQAKPDNFFTADTNLQAVLRFYLGAEDYDAGTPAWSELGALAATTLDHNARIEDRIGNHPRLERWSSLGERLESIEFHPAHDVNGALIWASGIMAMQARPGQTVRQMGLYYLLGHNGEAGHLCSLACTSGLIRALQQAADEPIQARFLPPLLDPNFDTMQHGAQFLTEVQGGSDVGANEVTAVDAGDGTWRINGEKWFCSNINAQQFLMTARATTAQGTRGLGLFIVPRQRVDGTTNGFYIRRLKDKLGTRTLASAELDFIDAEAYPLGPIERGFKTVVELVLNTSRLMNAVACAGVMRRAYIEASQYACHREAFGQPIANYPLVQEAIADLLSENYAATASSFYTALLLDRIETGLASSDEEATYRLLVNINKYITSIQGSAMVHRAIEVLGGNGAIESFSILPRLYRDMIVLESWEGTHNVLCLQVMRDIARYGIHEPFARIINGKLDTIKDARLKPYARFVRKRLSGALLMLGKIGAGGEHFMQAHARRFVDLLCAITQSTLLLTEADWEVTQDEDTLKLDVCMYYINQHLNTRYNPLDDDHYLDRLARIGLAI